MRALGRNKNICYFLVMRGLNLMRTLIYNREKNIVALAMPATPNVKPLLTTSNIRITITITESTLIILMVSLHYPGPQINVFLLSFVYCPLFNHNHHW